MAGGMFDQVLSWLKGTPTAPPIQLGMEKAPPLQSYPSQYDADYARNYGFADNNIHEDYLNNNVARVLGRDVPIKNFDSGYLARVKTDPKAKPVFSQSSMFVPDVGIGKINNVLKAGVDDPNVSQVIDLNKAGNRELGGDLRNVQMQAALAANRIPIAGVGFDPSRTMLDALAGDRGTTAGGYYSPTDSIYSNVSTTDPSTMVHESIHRGLQKLREQFPEQMTKLRSQLPEEEMIVRHLMQTQAGDPEAAGAISIGAQQQKTAANIFDTKQYPIMAGGYKKALDEINELAIEHMKGRGKRAGPQ